MGAAEAQFNNSVITKTHQEPYTKMGQRFLKVEDRAIKLTVIMSRGKDNDFDPMAIIYEKPERHNHNR